MPRCTLARTAIMLCLARIANESYDSCRAGATTSPLIIILCLQHTAFLLFTPFLVRNVIVRGSRYSCCLGYRLLFPYMILILLLFKKNLDKIKDILNRPVSHPSLHCCTLKGNSSPGL